MSTSFSPSFLSPSYSPQNEYTISDSSIKLDFQTSSPLAQTSIPSSYERVSSASSPTEESVHSFRSAHLSPFEQGQFSSTPTLSKFTPKRSATEPFASLLPQLSTMSSRSSQREEILTDIQKEAASMARSHKNLQSQLVQSYIDVHEMEDAVKRAQEESGVLKDEVQELSQVNNDLSFKTASTRETNAWLLKNNSQLKDQNTSLQKENERLKFELDTLRTQLVRFRDSTAALKKRSDQISQIEEENMNNRKRISALESLVEKLSLELGDQKSQTDKVTSELIKERRALEGKEMEFKAQAQILNDRVLVTEQETVSEREKLKREIERQEKEKEKIREDEQEKNRQNLIDLQERQQEEIQKIVNELTTKHQIELNEIVSKKEEEHAESTKRLISQFETEKQELMDTQQQRYTTFLAQINEENSKKDQLHSNELEMKLQQLKQHYQNELEKKDREIRKKEEKLESTVQQWKTALELEKDEKRSDLEEERGKSEARQQELMDRLNGRVSEERDRAEKAEDESRKKDAQIERLQEELQRAKMEHRREQDRSEENWKFQQNEEHERHLEALQQKDEEWIQKGKEERAAMKQLLKEKLEEKDEVWRKQMQREREQWEREKEEWAEKQEECEMEMKEMRAELERNDEWWREKMNEKGRENEERFRREREDWKRKEEERRELERSLRKSLEEKEEQLREVAETLDKYKEENGILVAELEEFQKGQMRERMEEKLKEEKREEEKKREEKRREKRMRKEREEHGIERQRLEKESDELHRQLIVERESHSSIVAQLKEQAATEQQLRDEVIISLKQDIAQKENMILDLRESAQASRSDFERIKSELGMELGRMESGRLNEIDMLVEERDRLLRSVRRQESDTMFQRDDRASVMMPTERGFSQTQPLSSRSERQDERLSQTMRERQWNDQSLLSSSLLPQPSQTRSDSNILSTPNTRPVTQPSFQHTLSPFIISEAPRHSSTTQSRNAAGHEMSARDGERGVLDGTLSHPALSPYTSAFIHNTSHLNTLQTSDHLPHYSSFDPQRTGVSFGRVGEQGGWGEVEDDGQRPVGVHEPHMLQPYFDLDIHQQEVGNTPSPTSGKGSKRRISEKRLKEKDQRKEKTLKNESIAVSPGTGQTHRTKERGTKRRKE